METIKRLNFNAPQQLLVDIENARQKKEMKPFKNDYYVHLIKKGLEAEQDESLLIVLLENGILLETGLKNYDKKKTINSDTLAYCYSLYTQLNKIKFNDEKLELKRRELIANDLEILNFFDYFNNNIL